MNLSFLNRRVSRDSKWKPSEHIRWTQEQDEIVVVDSQEGKVFRFNGTAASIWQSLCRHASAAEIAGSVVAEYDGAPQAIEKETFAFISELFSEDVIEPLKK